MKGLQARRAFALGRSCVHAGKGLEYSQEIGMPQTRDRDMPAGGRGSRGVDMLRKLTGISSAFVGCCSMLLMYRFGSTILRHAKLQLAKAELKS